MGLTEIQKEMIRGIATNNMLKARQGALGALNEDTMQKNKNFVARYKSILTSEHGFLYELPAELKGLLQCEDIESRKTGGNAPNNLITLCETCHKGYHNGTVILPKNIKHGMQFKDAAFMGIMRWTFYNTLKEQYEPDIPVSMTYGYLTKNTRIEHGLPKEHYIDARCISGNPDAVSDGTYYYQKKVRCHNRQIHK